MLLPRRRAGRRAPLWQQRKRASDLLAVAARFGSFPAVLETYRECLRDLFDLPALVGLLGRIERRSVRVVTVDSRTPSPFAASLLFSYIANYLYDGDAPLAERRAQALAIDQDQLHELLGEAELRELLDPDVIEQTERELQQFDARRRALTADTVHDLLLRVGDLSRAELAARGDPAGLDEVIGRLLADRRIVEATVGHDSRFVAAEDAARYRDAVGATLRADLPDTLLSSVADPLGDLVRRYARTHGPFHAEDVAGRLGIPVAAVGARLADLARTGWLVRGGFLPGGYGREWCQADVLKQIRRRTLARLRREVEPVGEAAYARFLASWHHVSQPRRGVEALLGVIEQLQGAPLVASDLEREILPCRLDDYRPADLDALMAHGEVAWVGLDPIGERDGRIAIFLADHLPRLSAPAAPGVCSDPRQAAIVDWLAQHGASFFGALHDAAGRGFPAETVRALWELVWAGRITNDTLMPLRSYVARTQHPGRWRDAARPRGRRLVPLTAEGRWSLVPRTTASASAQESVTEWAAATASQLLTRHGLVTRETLSAEVASGSVHAIAEVLRAMEASGRIRRGYFVSGLTAFQFIKPLALDLLRSFRDPAAQPATVRLAATDPANPYGAVIGWDRTGAAPWPDGTAPDRPPSVGRTPARTSGASVVLVDGALAAYLARGERQLRTFLPEAEPDRGCIAGEVARALADRATATGQGMLLTEIDGAPAAGHPFAADLERAGFIRRGGGLLAVARKDPGSVG